jgi:hypothetical protein
MDEEEAEKLLSQVTTPHRRLRVFAALLAKESGLGVDGMTVVGGSAIEIYTRGDYVSGDVDLIVRSRSSVEKILKAWSFRNEGKGGSKDRWGLFLDVMQGEISGSRRPTQIIATSVGPFRISAVEDLVIRRVRDSVAWQNREEAFAQAVLRLRRTGNDLDWEYIQFFAKREGWDDKHGELRRMASHQAT